VEEAMGELMFFAVWVILRIWEDHRAICMGASPRPAMSRPKSDIVNVGGPARVRVFDYAALELAPMGGERFTELLVVSWAIDKPWATRQE
jgi:hypothetical protein